jgi:large subunit ribosomal protein L1
MAAVPKRMKVWAEKIQPGKQYPIDEALALVKEFATAKFRESVDVAVNLGIDATKSDQQVRGSTVLPHGIGKSVRVAVFTSGKNQDAAREAGADIVGLEDLAEKVKAGELNFDVVIASPDARPDPRSSRPHAEPEGRYRDAERSRSGEKREGGSGALSRR